jgi:hypothetical protein
MASTDAMPVPKKNVAYRLTVPLLDADGDLVTGASGLDSEISKDGGTFADCTNEATEIATSSGVYTLDLTATEMNADTVAVIIKSSSAKTTVVVLYPQEGGDIRVDCTTWLGTAIATPDTAGYPKVTLKNGTGTGEVALTSGNVALTTAGNTAVVDALYASTAENNGTLTFKTIMRVLTAILAGRVSISGSTVTFKTPDNAKTRATVTTDSSNQRTAVTLDGTD